MLTRWIQSEGVRLRRKKRVVLHRAAGTFYYDASPATLSST
jgi:hypothetical protein